METVLTRSVTEAAEFIRRGGIVAFPTETVYGLGANVFDETAVEKIFAAKKRPGDNPLIAHVSSVAQIDELAREVTPYARLLITAFFPGPLTLVLPKSQRVPMAATAGLHTIGIRMPRLDLAREFLNACGVPLVAPSANLSGRPSPTTWQAVLEDLNGRVDCILRGDATQIGLESTVVDCTSDPPVLLRKGAVSYEQLRKILPEIASVGTADVNTPRSPGLKHKHYSPRAKVLVIERDSDITPGDHDAFIGIAKPSFNFKLTMICESVDEYAGSLFEFFRECDRREVEAIYCQSVPDEGIGAALMDRLRRASEG